MLSSNTKVTELMKLVNDSSVSIIDHDARARKRVS